jgi:hypothetical protein
LSFRLGAPPTLKPCSIPTVDEKDVLAFDDVEGLSGIAVDVQRRTEAGGLVRLEQRE